MTPPGPAPGDMRTTQPDGPAAGRATRPPTLVRHHLRWLLALGAALLVLFVASAMVFVMWPIGQRSADDLAGLMQLSAQTWVELPPATRPAFEDELLRAHRLVLAPDAPPRGEPARLHGFYIAFLEQALERRQGLPRPVYAGSGPTPGEWLWAELTVGGAAGVPAAPQSGAAGAAGEQPSQASGDAVGGRRVAVGFERARLATRPLTALAVMLLAGSLALVAVAGWLARRIAQPVTRLEAAAAAVAAGGEAPLLPESGPLELARLAGHFNTMTLRVRELLEARTTLLAGISHDLRTPLARMRLALEMLRLRQDDALIEKIERDIEAMNALIGQMLDLARGLGHEAARELPLAGWLNERAGAQADAARQAGASIDVSCLPGLAAWAAPGLLARVIDNLLGNALRHAPGPIGLAAFATPQGRVRIEVSDRGPGIPPSLLEAAWRPFQRVEGSRSPETGGYGLGLAIVRQLAQTQGWPVGLANRLGGGLVAWVELPAPGAGPAATSSGG